MSSWTFSFVNPWKGGLVLENCCSHMATSFLAFLHSLKQEFTSFPPSHAMSVRMCVAVFVSGNIKIDSL